MHTFCDEKFIYSVDLMHLWINKFKPKYEQVEPECIRPSLEKWCGIWRELGLISAKYLLDNRNKNQKFKMHFNRIKNADLSYPIIIIANTRIIVDGAHRLIKAFWKKQKKIRVYYVDKKWLKQFKIAKSGTSFKELENIFYDKLFHCMF